MKQLLLGCMIAFLIQGYLGKKADWDWEKKPVSPKDQELEDILDILRKDEEDDEDIFPEPVDLCENVHCGPGRICDQGECNCVKECTTERDKRRWVCSNRNQTYESDCHLYRARCLCRDEDPQCATEDDRHLHVEYYGVCRKIATCTEDDIVDFPRRMREWLFSVMKDLAEREELSDYYKKMEKDAEAHQSRRWSTAAVWKWCDLDKHPHDNIVSRHELFPLRAPLHSLEHCIAPFLDSCDKDNDHSITLEEWADCLELEVQLFVDKCEDIDS